MATQWSGLGSNTATATLDDSAENYVTGGVVDGYFDIIYPACTGIGRPVVSAVSCTINDGAADYTTVVRGNSDLSPSTMEEAEGTNSDYNIPLGMDTDDSSIFVCDANNHRIVKMSYDTMTYQNQYPLVANYPPSTWTASLHLRFPSDIAVDGSGNIYIADRDAHRVVKLNSSFVYQSQFGATDTPGSDSTHCRAPEGVAVDSSGNVYVSDTGNYRVIKLTSGLVYDSQYGQTGIPGAAINTLIQPTGLTIGEDAALYVADKVRLLKLDPTDMSADAILANDVSEEINSFYQNLAGEAYVTFAITENAAGDKYVLWANKRMVIKLDSSWQYETHFGEMKQYYDQTTTCTNPFDCVYHEGDDVLYVTDHTFLGYPNNSSRILILDGADLSYVDEYDCGEYMPRGIALYESDPTHDLYVSLNSFANDARTSVSSRVRGIDVSPDPSDPSLWVDDWTQDSYDGGSNDFLYVTDVEIDDTNTYVYACDSVAGATGIFCKMEAVDGDVVGSLAGWHSGWPPTAPGYPGPYTCVFYSSSQILVSNPSAQTIWDVNPNGAGAPTKTAELDDLANWGNDYPVRLRFNNNSTRLYVALAHTMLVYEYPLGGGSLAQKFLYDLQDVPYTDELDLDYEWVNVRAVYHEDDILYVCDTTGNTVTTINALSLKVMGQIGSQAISGGGTAAFNQPAGVAVIDERLYLSDALNHRVMLTSKHAPNIEAGTGRITFLMPPPSTYNAEFLVNFSPYQGIWGQLDNPLIFGRNYVQDDNTMYITTLGRGTPSIVNPSGGLGIYANMIERLPACFEIPDLGARLKDSFTFTPEPLPITSQTGGSPFSALPVINRYPASAQYMNNMYGTGTIYDYNRLLFVRGPGYDWPSGSYTVERGYVAKATFPGGDVLESFPLSTISIPRIIFATAIVELNGSVYMVIYTTYKAHAENILNDGEISADVFKIYGNCGIKPRY
jgi:hypothetical protein